MKNKYFVRNLLQAFAILVTIFAVFVLGILVTSQAYDRTLELNYKGLNDVRTSPHHICIDKGNLFIPANHNLLLHYTDFEKTKTGVQAKKVMSFLYLDYPADYNVKSLDYTYQCSVFDDSVFTLWTKERTKLSSDMLSDNTQSNRPTGQEALSRIDRFKQGTYLGPLVEFSFFSPYKMKSFSKGLLLSSVNTFEFKKEGDFAKVIMHLASDPFLFYFNMESQDWTTFQLDSISDLKKITDFDVSGNMIAVLDHHNQYVYLYEYQTSDHSLNFIRKIVLPEEGLGDSLGYSVLFLEKNQTIFLYPNIPSDQTFYWISSKDKPEFSSYVTTVFKEGAFIKGSLIGEESVYYFTYPQKRDYWKIQAIDLLRFNEDHW